MKEPALHVDWNDQKDALLRQAPIILQIAIDELEALEAQAHVPYPSQLSDLEPSAKQRKYTIKAWQAIVQFLRRKKTEGEILTATTGQEWMDVLSEFRVQLLLQSAASNVGSMPARFHEATIAHLENLMMEQKAKSFFLALDPAEQKKIAASVLGFLDEVDENALDEETKGFSPYEIVEYEQERAQDREELSEAVMHLQDNIAHALGEAGYQDIDNLPVGAEVLTDLTYEISDRLRELFNLPPGGHSILFK